MIKNWLPPIIEKKLKSCFLSKKASSFSGEYISWEEALDHCKGYDDADILKKVLSSTLKVKLGEAAYERDGIVFDKIEYSWEVIAGIMWAASRNSGQLCVLDIGGSLGTTYFQNKKFLDHINLQSWNIVEQPHYVKTGIKYIQDEVLKFYDEISNCLDKSNPNVILISSSFQYIRDLDYYIRLIKNIGAYVIIFDRTIIQETDSNKIFVQKASSSIGGSYPCYSISESWLINKLGKSYSLIEDFNSLLFPELETINSNFKGYIFSKN